MGPITLNGIAWAGENRITRVEVSTDGGAKWQDAKLGTQDVQFCWRTFQYSFTPAKPGHYLCCSRATDSARRVQPIEAVWNPSGYLNNSIDRIGIMVEG
jgi:hypothetical protein